MKKYIVTILICFVIAFAFAGCQEKTDPSVTPSPTPNVLTTVTPAPQAETVNILETEDFWRYVVEGEEVTIYGYVGEDIFEAAIPSEIDGLPVTKLSETAICYKMKIKVSDSQYYCDLTKLTIPASVKEVSLGLFSQCKYLTEVVIEDGADFSIQNGVLYNKDQTILYYCLNKNIESFVIPSTVKIIAAGAFRDCSKLSSITIPGNVEYIYDYAFYNCDNLTSVNVQEGTKSIGNQVFSYCFKLEQLHLPKTLLAIGEKSVSYTDILNIYIYKDSPIHQFFESEAMTAESGIAAHYKDFVVFIE